MNEHIQNVLIINCFIVFCLAALIGLLAGEDGAERVVAFVGVGWWLTCISVFGWFCYIVLHFVGKYW